jgi:hypothetical protein
LDEEEEVVVEEEAEVEMWDWTSMVEEVEITAGGEVGAAWDDFCWSAPTKAGSTELAEVRDCRITIS